MYVPWPIIVHITGEKLTENGPLLRAPSVFLGSFVSVLAVALTGTLNTLILPLKSHIPQFAWRWQGRVGCSELPADPGSSGDLSLACYSNQHHGIALPLPRGRLTLRQGHLRAGPSAAVPEEVVTWRVWCSIPAPDAAPLPTIVVLWTFPSQFQKAQLFFTPPNWLLFCSRLWPRFPAWLARPTMSVAYVNLVFLPAVVLSKHYHCG